MVADQVNQEKFTALNASAIFSLTDNGVVLIKELPGRAGGNFVARGELLGNHSGMKRGMRNFARATWRQSHRCLCVLSLLLFFLATLAAHQVRVRTAESITVELLPGDSSGGSENEEGSSHSLVERNTSSRSRSFVRIRLCGSTSSQPCRARFAHDAAIAGLRSFSERILPLRC